MKTRKITKHDLNNLPIDIHIDGYEATIIDKTMIDGMYVVESGKIELFYEGCLLANAMAKEEPETIDLYWTFDIAGIRCLCNANGDYPNFGTSKFSGIALASELRKSKRDEKPCMKIDAKTFEIIERY